MQLEVISCETHLQYESNNANDSEVSRICGTNVWHECVARMCETKEPNEILIENYRRGSCIGTLLRREK